MLGVNSVEAVRQMVTTGGKVEWRTDGGDAGYQFASRVVPFPSPFEQRVTAQRDAGCMQLPVAVGGVKAPKYPVNFFGITRVIGPRLAIQFARTAAKMRQRQAPAGRFAGKRRRDGVVAAGAALEG